MSLFSVVSIGKQNTEKDRELIACVETDNGTDLSKTLDKLALQLPSYMVPKQLIPVAVIPRSDRGKVDRNKLAEQLEF